MYRSGVKSVATISAVPTGLEGFIFSISLKPMNKRINGIIDVMFGASHRGG